MARAFFHANTRRMAVMLLVSALSLKTPAWGNNAGGAAPDLAAEAARKKWITLSLKIAEAKGNETSRRFFLSILRQRKRNPLRQISPGQTGFPPAP